MKFFPILSLLVIACIAPLDAKKCTPKTSSPAPSSAPTTTPTGTTTAPTTTPTSSPSVTMVPSTTAPGVGNQTTAPVTTPAPAATNTTGGSTTGGGSGKVLNKGAGDGTYYYNADGLACNQGTYVETEMNTMCESWKDPSKNKKLGEYHNNYIVALDLGEMKKRRDELCGKKVVVKHNGEVVPGNFVVWDGCEACTGGVRLDFSATALSKIDPDACNKGVIPGISWEVFDEQVMPFTP